MAHFDPLAWIVDHSLPDMASKDELLALCWTLLSRNYFWGWYVFPVLWNLVWYCFVFTSTAETAAV